MTNEKYKSAYMKHEEKPEFIWFRKEDMKEYNAEGKGIFSILLNRGYTVESINNDTVFMRLSKEVKDE